MRLLGFVHVCLRLALVGLTVGLVLVGPSKASYSATSLTRWQQVGLSDDSVTGVVAPISNSSVAYAATNGFRHGIFRTGNRGNTWEPKNTDLGVLDFRSLFLADPQTDNLLYAVGDLTLWKTLNRGESWVQTGFPWPSRPYLCTQNLNSIAATRVVYASMHQTWGDWICNASESWLIKSSDAARSWSKVTSVPQVPHSALAIAPSNQAIAYGAGGDQVLWTQDGGQSWRPLASVGRSYPVKTLTVHPQNSSIVYATTEKNGVYRSSNSGQSWDSLNPTLPTQGDDLQCPVLVIHPTQPEIVFMACNTYGVFWSRDGGDTWRERNEGFNYFLQIYSLAIAPLSTGISSRPLRQGLKGLNSHRWYLPIVMRSELPPLPPFVVYMGTEAGVWRLIGP